MIAELTETLPGPSTGETRRLAISGVGASGGSAGRARDSDELLAGGEGRPRFGSIGMGHSGGDDGELSTRYKDDRRAATAAKASDYV